MIKWNFNFNQYTSGYFSFENLCSSWRFFNLSSPTNDLSNWSNSSTLLILVYLKLF